MGRQPELDLPDGFKFFRRSSIRRGLAFSVFVLLGFFFGSRSVSAQLHDENLRSGGVHAPATAAGYVPGTRVGGDRQRISFITEDGRRVVSEIPVGTKYWNVKVGERIWIAYDPLDPTRVTALDGEWDRASLLWVCTFLLIGAVGVGNEIAFYRSVRAAARRDDPVWVTAKFLERSRPYAVERWVELTVPASLARVYVRLYLHQGFDEVPDRVEAFGSFTARKAIVVRYGGAYWWPRGRARTGYPVGATELRSR